MERYQYKAGTEGAALVSVNDEVCRLASNIKGVRGWYKGDEDGYKDTTNRGHRGEGEGL